MPRTHTHVEWMWQLPCKSSLSRWRSISQFAFSLNLSYALLRPRTLIESMSSLSQLWLPVALAPLKQHEQPLLSTFLLAFWSSRLPERAGY